jgi:microcystin degradation protein MlrC
MITSRRIAPVSLRQLTSCNLSPGDYQMIVAKGVHSPVAAYAPVCPTMIRVNTPGVTTADLSQLAYRNRRKPMFPFEQ